MAAPQEVAISLDTEATDHLLTAVPQEATAHSATIQAAVPIVLHIQIQAAQAVQAQAQDHQVAVAAAVAHAAVAA